MQKVINRIPHATDESIVKYDAKWGSCSCPDYTHRGGSYDLGNHETGCKHMARQRGSNPLVGPARVKAMQAFAAKTAAVQNVAPVKPVQNVAPVLPASIAWINFLELDPPTIEIDDPFAAFN